MEWMFTRLPMIGGPVAVKGKGLAEVVFTGFLLAIGVIIGAAVRFLAKNHGDSTSCNDGMLYGTVTDISKDPETGLTRITVEDGKGNVHYSFSSVPPESLKPVYLGKGWVQVPELGGKEKKSTCRSPRRR